MSAIPSLILLVVLLSLNAYFAMSEIAILSINSKKIERMAEEGNKSASLLLRITDDPSDFLSTIQIGITLANLLSSAVAAENFTVYFDQWLSFLPINPSLLHSIVLVLLTLLLAYVTLIFGELTPKRIAMKSPDELALKVVKVLWVLYKICRPFIRLLTASVNLVLRLLHINPHDEEEKVTEEEIRLMVEAGEEEGTIEEREKDMIENIFELNDRRVSELTTHRTEICAISADSSLQELVEIAQKDRYSRIPVYRDTIDDIIGVIHVKDLIPLLNEGSLDGHQLLDFLRPVIYVPETVSTTNLLKQFQEQKIHMAVVVDEYGGTSGIVTLEDLLESIVGEIDDEYDEQKEAYQQSKPDSKQKIAAGRLAAEDQKAAQSAQ
ncbi:MAG TPA: HlyC/CorC family transporter [Candidatus Merdivicinus intestinavium]|nr:HlyC/CorC family transporter [Candidatus Merdivicinus intestinavium]